MNVGIIGVSGYTGLELVKILVNHPSFHLNFMGTSQGGVDINTLHPSLEGVYRGKVEKTCIKEVAKDASLVFLALPHKTAMGYAKELLEHGLRVVDLSADYRLEQKNYEKFYCPHEDIKNLTHAVYGLPELYLEEIKQAKLIANPGCYPTATLLGLLPFVDCLDINSPIFIDAKSGVSGAGKKLNETTSFVKVNDNIFSYNPLSHRHEPEIAEKLELTSGNAFKVHFVPQLIPVTRGMLVNIYCTLSKQIDAKKRLKEYYSDKKFVRIRENPVSIKDTAGTNFCDIFVKQKEETLFISTSIDNLLRGASSQAVVNANLMCGFDEDLGIPKISYAP